MRKFQKRPVQVEAVQFEPGMLHPWVERQRLAPNAPTIAEHEESYRRTGLPAPPLPLREFECVRGRGRWLRPEPGDWIVEVNEGDRILVKPGEFAATYERLSAGTDLSPAEREFLEGSHAGRH